MRRFLAGVVGVMTLGVIGSSLAVMGGGSASASPAMQGGVASSCIAVNKKEASPEVILLGETVDVTLSVTALCSGEQFPLHIVLVLDNSGSMTGEPEREMKKAAKELVRNLNLKDNPATQVGVVEFNSVANIRCQLTNQSGRVNGCIGGIRSGGGTQIDAGIRRGMQVLTMGRSGFASSDEIREVMVVLSDGESNSGCGPVEAEANRAKGQGVLLITVCVGAGCDAACMRRLATSARYFFEARNPRELTQVFEAIRRSFQNILLKQMTVIDNIPDNMEFIVGSDEPPAKDTGTDYDQLTWQTSFVPRSGVTYTFRLKPLDVGYHPTNNGASGEFRDNKNRTGTFTFRDPWILVLNPEPLSTPTAPPTPTPTNTKGPTPTNTPTNTPTPTPTPGPIYLPIAVREYCVNDERLADVALVLDMSTSMDRLTEDGVVKKDAVISSAKFFVEQLDFVPNDFDQHDQVSVVWFNDNAAIEQTLTGDKDAILAAIDRLPSRSAEGTRLDKAFRMGTEALPAALRKVDNTPVMIMLTDGLPNRVPLDAISGRQEETVITAAAEAKAAGITVYTIGFGREDAPEIIDRVNPWLLEQCASDPGKAFVEPRADRLTGIYSDIAYVYTCPKGAMWTRRGAGDRP